MSDRRTNTANYFAQQAAAMEEQVEFYRKLKAEGWVWNEGGYYEHPDVPDSIIMPG